MTVRELVATPHLRTRVLAGEAGIDQAIAWAHVYDVPAPWEWLAKGEFVMASGLGIPAGAQAQSEYIERLHGAGATGLTISEHHLGPPVTDEMLATADRLGFPLLETAWEVSYATLARAVADVGRDAAIRLSSTERIYSALHAATLAGLSGGRLISEVAASQGCRAAVLGRATGGVVMSDPERPVPAVLIDQVAASLRDERRAQPARAVRVTDGTDRGLAVSMALDRAALLILAYEEGQDPDPVVVRHLATVATSEHERTVITRRREQDRGAEVLERTLEGSLRPDVVAAEIAERGLGGALCVVAVDRDDADPEMRNVYFAFAEAGIPVLMSPADGRSDVLVQSDDETVTRLLSLLSGSPHVGVSEPFEDVGRVGQAARQAHWTLNLARATGQRVVRHVDHRLAAFLPETLDDAANIVERILGPLIEYDDKGIELVGSLRAFLEENRSWQRTAARLYVHKQTLVYRMRKVEELTGLRLDRTEDVTQLWLALRTRDMLD